ncbi:MAG: DUF3791 domain-containing protein [Clostridiales bacterium]|nr:DUF3791 domain-containing protein [Clostridiales bacterium]
MSSFAGNVPGGKSYDRQVIKLFKQYCVLDYVISCYEALHTTGTNYIIEDIDLFIKARQPV